MNGHFKINNNVYVARRRLLRGDIEDGVVVAAEPMLEWAKGKSVKELKQYCESRDWKLEVYLNQ